MILSPHYPLSPHDPDKHRQTILIEAATLAPGHSPYLRELYARELKRGNRNQATIAVARQLVAWLMAVDKKKEDFRLPEKVAA